MKDPAFLFYSQDFLIGVAHMTDEEIGQYIKVLCFLHTKGRIEQSKLERLVGKLHDEVKEKLSVDDNNCIYNSRLEKEAEKRRKYSESRRKNRLGKKKKNISFSCEKHMENENENENENIKLDNNNKLNNLIKLNNKAKKKKFSPPTEEEVYDYFLEKTKDENYSRSTAKKFINHYEILNWTYGKTKTKLTRWKNAASNWCADYKPRQSAKSNFKQLLEHRNKNSKY